MQKPHCPADTVPSQLHYLGLHSQRSWSWPLPEDFLQLLKFCQSDMWKMVSQGTIICISLIRSKAAHIFIWLRAICLSFFREQSVHFPSPFIYQVIDFFFSIFRGSLYIWCANPLWLKVANFSYLSLFLRCLFFLCKSFIYLFLTPSNLTLFSLNATGLG